jgi:hypothetical protein
MRDNIHIHTEQQENCTFFSVLISTFLDSSCELSGSKHSPEFYLCKLYVIRKFFWYFGAAGVPYTKNYGLVNNCTSPLPLLVESLTPVLYNHCIFHGTTPVPDAVDCLLF